MGPTHSCNANLSLLESNLSLEIRWLAAILNFAIGDYIQLAKILSYPLVLKDGPRNMITQTSGSSLARYELSTISTDCTYEHI